MMKVDDFFADAALPCVNMFFFLPSAIREAMKTKEIAIPCLNNVFFSFVAV
jgi:hypothetical protein